MDVRLVVADIDGTLTVRRGSLLISLEAVEAIRELEAAGVRVALISGNSLPVTRAVAVYAGAGGPVAGENGCVGMSGRDIVHLSGLMPPRGLVEELRELGLEESWQNPFRFHDLAFIDRVGVGRGRVEEVVSRYSGFRVVASGYAYHVVPVDCGKGVGLEWIARAARVSLARVLAVGDAENDVEMFRAAGYSAAPADAEEAAKREAGYVASQPGGRGFAEIARMILKS